MAGRRFIFCAGAEGSGTTLLQRLLAAPSCCASLGGNFVKLPPGEDAAGLAAAFRRANTAVWDRSVSFADHATALAAWRTARDRILAAQSFAGIEVLLFKRSWPFGNERDRYAPDLWDLEDLCPGSRHVVIYRDPRAATYSALRRGFDADLRRLAVVCAEQLTRLSAPAAALPQDRVRVVSYEALCTDPPAVLGGLADFCGLPRQEVLAAAHQGGPLQSADTRFRTELGPEAAWLDEFFDARRLRQWAGLFA